MSPTPQSDTTEVINSLMYQASLRPLYPLELMKLKKAAQSILHDAPWTAHSVFGVVACLQGDEKTMRREHELSISLNPGDAHMHSNFASSLKAHDFVAEAIPFQVRAVELAPEDVGYLDSLLRLAYRADATDILERWLPEFRKRVGHEHEVEAWIAEDQEDLREIDEAGVAGPCISLAQLKAEMGL